MSEGPELDNIAPKAEVTLKQKQVIDLAQGSKTHGSFVKSATASAKLYLHSCVSGIEAAVLN